MGLAVRFNVRTLMYILLVAMVLLLLDLFFMLSFGGRHKNKFIENKTFQTRVSSVGVTSMFQLASKCSAIAAVLDRLCLMSAIDHPGSQRCS